jgi:uncharacterized protein YecE (DUF72 family)
VTNLVKKVFIGTSGWSYSHWKENFYPKGLKSKDWLNYYSTTFSTVEVNSTFYRLPLSSTVQNWNSQVPKNFLFAVKASRYMTHQKRLKDCEDAWVSFSKVMKNLKSKIGPILFQLPPSFKMDKDRLIEFMSCLNDEYEYVFEFRNATWFIDEIYELLSQKRIALCITDLNGHLSPEEITAHFTYIRLHGPKKAYQGSYGISKLKSWKRKIETWASKTSVYCYFDNDEKGFAIEDAKSLQDLLEKS